MLGKQYLLLLCLFCGAYGASILVFVPMPSGSLVRSFHSLFRELANRGHNITMVSVAALPPPVPATFTDVVIGNLLENSTVVPNMNDMGRQLTYFHSILLFWNIGLHVCDSVFKHPKLIDVIRSKQKYDLVISVPLFFQECVAVLSHKFNAHSLNIHPTELGAYGSYILGNQMGLAYLPDIRLPYSDKMSFWQRIINYLFGLVITAGGELYYIPRMEAIVKHAFPEENFPPLGIILRNTTVTLIENHFTFHYPRPYLPGIIPVGGLMLHNKNKLPKDLNMWMNSGKAGVILFSLGGNAQSTLLRPEHLAALINTFSKLPQHILWKWEGDKLPGKPANVKISKWLPQADILAHPNCQLFITHGGLHSLMEAVYYSVPIVGIPIFNDQEHNLVHMQDKGVGSYLTLDEFTENKLLQLVQKVLYDSSYKKNVERLSRIFRDQPMSALDTGIYWVEYVLRHNGAHHLKSAALDLSWYQLTLLDVIAFVLFVVSTFLYISYITICYTLKVLGFSYRGKKLHKSKSKK